MNDAPRSSAIPPVVEAGEKSVPPLRYKAIWCINALATILAAGFFMVTSMATSDFLLTDLDWDIFPALISLSWSLPAVGVGTVLFLWTKRLLLRRSASSRVSWRWLGLPAWISALLLIAYASWNCLPQQRLKTICKGNSVAARDIRVVGATGLQLAEWLGAFQVSADEFQSLVRKLDLKSIPAEEFVARLDELRMLRDKPLVAGLLAAASTNVQCFKWEYTGIDGAMHGDIHACFDATISRAVVTRSGY